MKFSEAMELIEKGEKVRCCKWDAECYLVKGRKPNGMPCILDEEGEYPEYLGELINEEWEAYRLPNYDFIGALHFLKLGKNVRRGSWENEEWSICMDDNEDIISADGEDHNFNMQDFIAKDWVIV